MSRRVSPMTVEKVDLAVNEGADKIVSKMREAGLAKIEIDSPLATVDSNGTVTKVSEVELKTTSGQEYKRDVSESLTGVAPVATTTGMMGTTMANTNSDGTMMVADTVVRPVGFAFGMWGLILLVIAVFIIWLVGVWTGSGSSSSAANYYHYTAPKHRYDWASLATLGIFTTFALVLLFLGTAMSMWVCGNTTCKNLAVASFVMYALEVILFIIAVIVLLRTDSTSSGGALDTSGANAAFWLTLVGVVLLFVQFVVSIVMCLKCSSNLWFGSVLPLALALAWGIVALVCLYRMWKGN